MEKRTPPLHFLWKGKVRMELTKTYRFEASHILPKHPGKCSRLHGHSWILHVSVEGPINPETGFVMDFGDISKVVEPLVERLDHRHLGTWEMFGEFDLGGDPYGEWGYLPRDLYPTSENLLWWIAGQLGLDSYQSAFIKVPQTVYPGQVIEVEELGPEMSLVTKWSKISIEETCTSQATLTREEYDAKS